MGRPTDRALLDVLAQRADLLETLERGITDKREIEDRLDVSRATVNRGLEKLRAAHLITTHPIEPELTVFGKIALEEFQAFDDRFADLVEAKPLLRHLPVDAEFDMRIVESAEVVLSREIAPLEPYIRLEEMIQHSDAESIRGLSLLMYPDFIELIRALATNADMTIELLFKSDILHYLSSNYNTEIRELLETGRVTIRQLDALKLSYGLAIVDNVGVWVGMFERGAGLRGALINTSDQAFEWAEGIYSKFRARSSPVASEDLMLRGSHGSGMGEFSRKPTTES